MNTSYRPKRANATAEIEMDLCALAQQLAEISERLARVRKAGTPRMSRDIVALCKHPKAPVHAAGVTTRRPHRRTNQKTLALINLIPDARRFGQRLRELRVGQSLSVEALAELISVTTSSVYRWESGRTRPSVNGLVALADLYGISLDALAEKTFETTVEPTSSGVD